MADPLYYLHADGKRVFKRPVETARADGRRTFTLGFPVCTVSEGINPQDLVDMLNFAEGKDNG